MHWALLAVILIGLFLISGRFPKIAFSVFGLLMAGVVAVLIFTGVDNRQRSGRIGTSDIVLSNMVITESYAGGHRLSGRLTNNHVSAALRQSTLNVAMLDCSAEDECTVIAQQSERLTVKVPAGQARDFTANLYFGNVTIKGTQQWRYELTATKG